MLSWPEEDPGERGGEYSGIESESPTRGVVGDIGGDLDLCRLPDLLFGRGGGGSPLATGVSALFGDGGRKNPGECSNGARIARVCSSYSNAARKLGDIFMFFDRGRDAFTGSL